MNVSVYNAQEGNESVEDVEVSEATFKGLKNLLVECGGRLQFEYDEEKDAISAMTECGTCNEFDCQCDDEGEDLGDEEEEE